MGLNSAHLIADYFTGSGQGEARNTIPTSAHYNQVEMGKIEKAIRLSLDDNATYKSLDLTVDIRYGQIDDDTMFAALEKDLLDHMASGKRDRYQEYFGKTAAQLKAEVLNNLADVEFKRVIFSKYNWIIHLSNSDKKQQAQIDDPDVWIGLKNKQ